MENPGLTRMAKVGGDAAADLERGSAVVAMAGAGQLAQMTHQAAISLGVELRVLAASESDSAVRAGAPALIAPQPEEEDLRELAAGADVLTFDHEGLPPDLLARLEADGVRLEPSAASKLLAQDKLRGRRELSRLGFPLPPFVAVSSREEVEAFGERHGWPLVAKLPRGGYDGRGVFELEDGAAAARLLEATGVELLIEPRLEIERELAVLVARVREGESAVYPVAETVQREAICREILVPAPVSAPLSERAGGLALEIAAAIGSTGVLAVEMFVVGGELLINELALRPHNSGHFTIEGCATSQFEQHLRAVLGWPLGDPGLRAPAVVTANVLGPADGSDPRSRVPAALAAGNAHVHLYGKAPRPGRKLGHVTVLGTDLGQVRAEAVRVAQVLERGTDG